MSSASAGCEIYPLINRKTSVSEIEQLLKEGKSPHRAPHGCLPPVHRAVRFNRPDIALVLLLAGGKVRANRYLEQLYTPLITLAASLRMTQVVLKLCARPECKVFAVDNDLRTIVHISVARKNHELLRGLLSCCRKHFSKFLIARDGLGWTPLHLAASMGDLSALKLLLQLYECQETEQHQKQLSAHAAGSNVQDPQGDTVLNSSQGTNQEEILKTCQHSSEKEAERLSAGVLHEKVGRGVKLIEHPVLGSKETMLHLAAKGHHVEMVQFLVDHGANVNAQDMLNNTPLHLLVSHGNANRRALSAARCLLTAGADCRLKGNYHETMPLYLPKCLVPDRAHRYCREHSKVTVGTIAALRNRVAYLKLLEEWGGAGLEGVDEQSMTALMHALSHGCEEAAHYLLVHHPHTHPSPTWTDWWGETALHLVSYCNSKAGKLTELLLAGGHGAALESRPVTYPVNSPLPQLFGSDMPSFTPLTRAIKLRQLQVLKTLVAHAPRCLLKDFTHIHHSPLHVTLLSMHDERCAPFVDFLLAHGSDGNAMVCGQTAYGCATREVYDQEEGVCAAYLKKKMGVFFREEAECAGERGELRLHFLRDLCMERVRQLLRAAQGNYFEDVCSLPLPQSLIQGLLFQSQQE